MYQLLLKENKIGNESETQMENKIKINKVLETLHYARNTLEGFYHLKNAMDINHDFNPEDDHSLYTFQTLDIDELKPNAKLILYVMQKFSELK